MSSAKVGANNCFSQTSVQRIKKESFWFLPQKIRYCEKHVSVFQESSMPLTAGSGAALLCQGPTGLCLAKQSVQNWSIFFLYSTK